MKTDGQKTIAQTTCEAATLVALALAGGVSLLRSCLVLRTSHAVNFDEAYVVTLARQPFSRISHEVLNGEANSFLHYYLAAVVEKVAQGSVLFALRLVSILFIVASAVLVGALARELRQPRSIQFACGFLQLAAPMTLQWSPAARYYSMFSTLVLAAVIAAVRFVRRPTWLAASALAGFGILSITTAAISSLYIGSLVLTLIYVVRRERRGNNKLNAQLGLILIAPLSAVALAVQMRAHDRGQVSWISRPSARGLLTFVDDLGFQIGSSDRAGFGRVAGRAPWMALFALVLFGALALGWRQLSGERSARTVLTVATAMPLVGMLLLSRLGTSLASSRYFIPHTALVALFVGCGLRMRPGGRLLEHTTKALLGITVAVLAIAHAWNPSSVGFVRAPLTANLRNVLERDAMRGDVIYLNPMMHTMTTFELVESNELTDELPRPVAPTVPWGGITQWGRVPLLKNLPDEVVNANRVWVVASRGAAGASNRDTFQWVTREIGFVEKLQAMGFSLDRSAATDSLLEAQQLELWVRTLSFTNNSGSGT